MDAPYSQCDAKGRCIRHPTIQMSRKKKLGGWKKLLGICPMCAMELMASSKDGVGVSSSAQDAMAQRAVGPSSSAGGRPLHVSDSVSVGHRSTNNDRHRRPGRPRVGHHHHDDQSVISAPAAYSNGHGRTHTHHHRRTSHDALISKGHSSDSSSSCDTTVDMSASEEGSHRSRRSQGGHPAPPSQEAESFVCGMEYDGMYYTGQIHVESQLPHGLGTLRSDVDGTIYEGMWNWGRLVKNAAAQQAANAGPQTTQEYHQEEDNQHQARQHHAATAVVPVNHPVHQETTTLSEDFHRQASIHPIVPPRHLHNQVSGLPSCCSNSIAETIHDDDDDDTETDCDTESDLSASEGDWSRNSSLSSYSARESKGSTTDPSSGLGLGEAPARRVAFDKLREFERYIVKCDEDLDYYYQENKNESSPPVPMSSCERQRKVRFREDP